jgi:hypothetical protein
MAYARNYIGEEARTGFLFEYVNACIDGSLIEIGT